jgi:hypothetical protein
MNLAPELGGRKLWTTLTMLAPGARPLTCTAPPKDSNESTQGDRHD